MKLAVIAGDHDRPAGPASTRIPEASADALPGAMLVDQDNRYRTHCQIDDRSRLVWWCPAIAAGESRTFTLVDAGSRAEIRPVSVAPGNPYRMAVHDRNGLLTEYCFDRDLARPILYPINGPSGQSVTRHYPMKDVASETHDHIHHRSCWVAWGDVNGVDHWSENDEHGRQRHRSLSSVYGGPVCGGLTAVIDWIDPDDERQLVEHRTYRFYNCPADVRMFDLTVRMALTPDS